jgi:hypothetical protein
VHFSILTLQPDLFVIFSGRHQVQSGVVLAGNQSHAGVQNVLFCYYLEKRVQLALIGQSQL